MGRDSKIEWTNHTFNPWWGCVKVSQACKYCYAESWSRRVGAEVWGPSSDRRFFGEKHWQQPVMWDREAKKAHVRKRVFCASMADVFEDREDLNEARGNLWELIGRTPWLDWLLLTKRPQSIQAMTPWGESWPRNVWLGTTAEDQATANERVPHLLKAPSVVHFVSCEPLLGPLDLKAWLPGYTGALASEVALNWIIVGGESGGKSRPTHPEWILSLRDQSLAAGAAFHFKQWGNWRPTNDKKTATGKTVVLNGDDNVATMERVSKKVAGRLLERRTWDDLPTLDPNYRAENGG